MNVIESILHEFPLGRQDVERLIRTAPSRYKVHEIEKRNGRGMRTIAQPCMMKLNENRQQETK